MEVMQLASFNQKSSVETQNVEKATAAGVAEWTTKGKLTLSALGSPYLEHMLTHDTVFEHIHLHLLLFDYLSSADV